MKDKIEFKKIREFGDIIGDTFVFIKQNFKPLMAAFFSLTGIFILGGMISAIIAQLQLVDLAQGEGYTGGPFAKMYNMGFSYILMIIFLILSYTSMYVSVLSFVALYIEKGNVPPTVAEVWVYFKYYFFRMLGSGVLMSIFLGLCFICCIIPGIYVFPAVTLFYAVMILENGNFSHAFERSFKLLKNEWWITAATILVVYVIFYACSLIVQIPSFIIAIVGAFTHAEQPITRTYAFVSSIFQQIAYIFMIIPIISSTFIYYNLVERKESLGLLNRIDGLGQNSNQAETPEEY
ncbi:hypothetical protein [Pedobacter boryungensis]|uniref:Glycerophosphoryl diester phosphodiesterase membrane domain-containing protein n=1 Tax=Pedobacter boryungensis TaxID=869962 RepID=A0ABX2DCZ3_9SPHI|nr:hypothetical protein [Pedobacter boryungensis]NQX31870.1 hypothetical protein [Pedobacter boryungensis]